MKFAKLISEAQSTCLIRGKQTEEEIKRIFLDANLHALYDHLAASIVQAKLFKPHYYRFKIQVHAQEVEPTKVKKND